MSHRPLAAVVVLLLVVSCADSRSTETAVPEVTSEGQGTDSGSGPAPTGVPLMAGLTEIEVLGPPSGEAGDVPRFRWEPVAAAATYHLVVLGPDGPLWAWQGQGTDVWLGGLPFERPPGVAGPVIVAGTCWSVAALNGDGHVVAASDFLVVSPNESTGDSCIPGSAGS